MVLRCVGALLLALWAADARADCEQNSCDEDVSLLQASTKKRVQPKVAIFTTGGASSLCCDCDDVEDRNCCSRRHTGKRTMHAALAAKAGVEEAGGNATIFDLTEAGGCPDKSMQENFDAFMVGSPVWFSGPSPDMMTFMITRFTREGIGSIACKPGAAFATGGSYFNGIQSTIDAIHRAMMTSQMVIVGGPHWHIANGGGAVTGTYPYSHSCNGERTDDRMEETIAPLFEIDMKALGARLVNFTRALGPVDCGEYPGLEEMHDKTFPDDTFIGSGN